MKQYLGIFFLSAAAFFLTTVCSSCTYLSEIGKTKTEKKNATKKPEVQKVGENLVKAFVSDKPDLFMKELPEEVAQRFTKKDFGVTRKSMVQQIGTPVSYQYIRNIEHPLAIISLWVIRYERQVKGKKAGKVYMETLFRAAYGKVDGKYMLLSFNFL